MLTIPISTRPRRYLNGEAVTVIDRSEINEHSEFYAILRIVTNYPLFGLLYWNLVGRFFYEMTRGSGVFVAVNVESKSISPTFGRPGDIDILVIPYFMDMLLADRILAIEVKVVRASFSKPGRAANKLGFTQADALAEAGFPYVAVVHAVASDSSPEEYYRDYGLAIMKDSERVREMREIKADPLPMLLVERVMGRLEKSRSQSRIGLGCIYTGESRINYEGKVYSGQYYPEGREARWCPEHATELMPSVAAYLNRNPHMFLDIPRW